MVNRWRVYRYLSRDDRNYRVKTRRECWAKSGVIARRMAFERVMRRDGWKV